MTRMKCIFIDCGGEGFIDKDGNEWIGDQYVPGHVPVGGRFSIPETKISGTTNDILYRSERFHNTFEDKSMVIKVDVPPGLYDVRLHFAEIFFEKVDKQVFDVFVQDNEV